MSEITVLKSIQYRIEAFFVIAVLALLGALPIDMASAIPGKLMRFVGPRMKRHSRVMENLVRFMPELSDEERNRSALTMWENVGRVFGEIPHTRKIIEDPERFRYVGMEEAVHGLAEDMAAVLVSGHFGNWELSLAPSVALGRRQISFYREIKNPVLEKRLKRYRQNICTGELVAKGADSMKRAMEAAKKGSFIGMLVDQRESQGIDAPFLGVDAKTNHAPALLVCRYNIPLLAGCVIREKGAHFRIECMRLPVSLSGDKKADVQAITGQINDLIGGWVKTHPEQWLWSSRRW